MLYEIKELLRSKQEFPCRLTKNEGILLKQVFTLDESFIHDQKDIKDIEHRYFLELDGETYTLIEEYMFRDWETELDINRAIGVNYYLFKE